MLENPVMCAAHAEPENADRADVVATADASERQYATLIHALGFLNYPLGPLGVIVPLAMWLAKRDESPFIDDHGREAMNFNITIWIYAIFAGLLVFAGIGCVLVPAVMVFDVTVRIMATVRASGGGYFRYPMTIRFLRG
jgi:uncharacterized Tic20 family protein